MVAPFVLGTVVVAPWLLPQASQHELLFIGAALCATSVGITGRVFKDMNCLHLREAKIVLGAAVIDDVLGLIILAVVSALASAGSVNVATVALISVKALGFLVAAVWLGQRLDDVLGLINKAGEYKKEYLDPNLPNDPLPVIFRESAVTVSPLAFASKRLLTIDRYTFKNRGIVTGKQIGRAHV